MRSAAEPSGDPGLAAERTALAWQRMALSFTSLSAVTLAAAAHRDAPWMLAPAALLFGMGAAIWLYARRRAGERSRRTGRRAVALLTAAVLVAACVAAVLAVIRVG